MEITKTKSDQIFKDYKEKILNKFYSKSSNSINECADINSMIIFFNYCFQNKNNFFIEDFNQRLIYHVNTSYNKLKTNVLSEEPIYHIYHIFTEIKPENLKTIKFILLRYTKVYDEIYQENRELCDTFDKEAAKNCISYINQFCEKSI